MQLWGVLCSSSDISFPVDLIIWNIPYCLPSLIFYGDEDDDDGDNDDDDNGDDDGGSKN